MSTLFERGRLTAHLAWELRGQRRIAFASPADVERAQRRRLARRVAHAYATVPYYRETMRRLGLAPQDLGTVADLARLPLLDPEAVRRDPEYFVSRAGALEDYLALRSSGGSGGAPKVVFHDAVGIVETAAHAERHRVVVRKLAGAGLGYREAVIESPGGATRSVHSFLARQIALPPGGVIRRRYLSLLDSPEENAAMLERFRPHVLEGYGSYLAQLLLHLRTSGRAASWLPVVVYGSDALPSAVRRLATEEMGLKVSSVYGAVEALQIGFECERGLGYHLNVDLVPVRVIGPQGTEQPVGESGEIVVSNLVNRASVLLNYRLGDIGHLLTRACPCGRRLPLLSFIDVRRDDWITASSGARVHPQAVRSLFSDEPGVLQFQVRQLRPGVLHVAIVPRNLVDRDRVRARLLEKLARRLGDGTSTSIDFVDALPRTPGGKVRVVSRVGS
jgi:phenylacetate-CoA ligase